MMHSFCGSLKSAFSSLRISGRVRLVQSLTGHMGGIGGRSWSTKNLLTHLRREPLTQCSMSSGEKELLDFRCCEFVIVPNSKVCQGRGAFAVKDNFGSAFLFGDHMHGPTCLG